MNIVIGRGRNRRVIELPGGNSLAQFAKRDPDAYTDGVRVILDLCGIRQPDPRVRF